MHNNFYSHVSRDKRRREEDDNSDRSKETKKSKEVGLFGCHWPYLIYDVKIVIDGTVLSSRKINKRKHFLVCQCVSLPYN